MVSIAGKPIIGHILDRLIDLNPEEVIFIVGYLKENLIAYVEQHYQDRFRINYVEQKERLGLGHSIYTGRELIGNSDFMIALGDMIFKKGYNDFYQKYLTNGHCTASIGVKEVSNPEKYGIVEIDNNSNVIKLEEKPEYPSSNLGIAGVYFIKDSGSFFHALNWLIDNGIKTRGEYQLTDVFQKMVENGSQVKTFEVSSWYDCGHSQSLLETNRVLLKESSGNVKSVVKNGVVENSVIIDPVSLGANVKIRNSVIGPYISIADGTLINNSVISNSVIGAQTSISNATIERSIIGENASLKGKSYSLNLGDSSSIEF
jgi:glucose-1-phosphate thymidylyltransferase